MRRLPRPALPWIALVSGMSSLSLAAHAGPLDLNEPAPASSFGTYVPPPPPVAKGHAYTLAECLSLADRNHPNLWAARARLAYVHAQLEEIKWIPFWQFTSNVGVAVLPPLYGTAQFSSSSPFARNPTFEQQLDPLLHFDINGALPIYTFGKISSANEAARAGVRVSEWDLEKVRQQTRM